MMPAIGDAFFRFRDQANLICLSECLNKPPDWRRRVDPGLKLRQWAFNFGFCNFLDFVSDDFVQNIFHDELASRIVASRVFWQDECPEERRHVTQQRSSRLRYPAFISSTTS